MGECTRSGFCNFMHLKPISRDLRRFIHFVLNYSFLLLKVCAQFFIFFSDIFILVEVHAARKAVLDHHHHHHQHANDPVNVVVPEAVIERVVIKEIIDCSETVIEKHQHKLIFSLSFNPEICPQFSFINLQIKIKTCPEDAFRSFIWLWFLLGYKSALWWSDTTQQSQVLKRQILSKSNNHKQRRLLDIAAPLKWTWNYILNKVFMCDWRLIYSKYHLTNRK